jgi:hypothetical protein
MLFSKATDTNSTAVYIENIRQSAYNITSLVKICAVTRSIILQPEEEAVPLLLRIENSPEYICPALISFLLFFGHLRH